VGAAVSLIAMMIGLMVQVMIWSLRLMVLFVGLVLGLVSAVPRALSRRWRALPGWRTPVASPAGWYPQPDGRLRYWDGRQWTEHVARAADQVGPEVAHPGGPVRPEVTLSASFSAVTQRLRTARAAGWGGLALAVLVGAVSSDLRGALGTFGVFALVVGLTTSARGRIRRTYVKNRRSGMVAVVVAITALALAGCATAQTTANKTPGSTTPNVAAITPATQMPIPVKPSTVRHTNRAMHWPPGQVVITPTGAVLPNSVRTPGATNPVVTQATIGRTICVAGWTDTVRPSSSLTTALKEDQLASGYAYKGDRSTSDYEEDHLISLELGGSPSSPSNLWPEPYNTTEGARVKDAVENKLHALVCEHTISLATAQRAIAANWWTAYQKYEGITTAPAHSVSTPRPAPATVSQGNGATALCNDGTYSYAAHHQGACSHHGGVKIFYK
jgi:Protein of unknown function (DUF3761)/Protein of unknown function (DUF2510)